MIKLRKRKLNLLAQKYLYLKDEYDYESYIYYLILITNHKKIMRQIDNEIKKDLMHKLNSKYYLLKYKNETFLIKI